MVTEEPLLELVSHLPEVWARFIAGVDRALGD